MRGDFDAVCCRISGNFDGPGCSFALSISDGLELATGSRAVGSCSMEAVALLFLLSAFNCGILF